MIKKSMQNICMLFLKNIFNNAQNCYIIYINKLTYRFMKKHMLSEEEACN